VLLTEDMHSGLLIDGLVIQNPFKQAQAATKW